MTIYEASEYKDLSVEEFTVFMDAVEYAIMDYSYFLEETEPYATNTIRRFRDAANSLNCDENAKFLEWLQKQ